MQASTISASFRSKIQDGARVIDVCEWVDTAGCPKCGAVCEYRTQIDHELILLMTDTAEQQTAYIESERVRSRERLQEAVAQHQCQTPKG